ncbi:MAG: YncE family protein [Planctomycetota bacterium]
MFTHRLKNCYMSTIQFSSFSKVAATLSLLIGSASLAPAQNFLGEISTAGYGQNSGFPYGLNFGPNGDLYIALAGTSAFVNPQFFNNNVVVRADTSTNLVTSTITVGMFPEEVVFASPNGGAAVGIVTNSTDGTVSIFDVATEQILGTVHLPGGFFATFPFGIVTNATETIAYISTGDGTNTLRAIDLDPNSATVYQYISGSDLPLASGNAARMVRSGDVLLFPTTAYDPFFAGSTANIEKLPLPGCADSPASVVVGFDNTFTKYPSGQDVVVLNGIAYVCGYDMGKRIYGFDILTGALVRSFPGGTFVGAHTGLALSPNGKILVVCDVASNQISFIDIARGLPMAVVDTNLLGFGYSQPNDAVFSPDGSKIYVTVQGSQAVVIVSVPPTPGAFTPPLGFVVTPTAPAPGGLVTLSTLGAGPSEFVAIMADDFDDAIDLGSFGILHFTANATVVATNASGDFTHQVNAPSGPAFYGKNFLCQAISIDLSTNIIKLSDEIPVVLQ